MSRRTPVPVLLQSFPTPPTHIPNPPPSRPPSTPLPPIPRSISKSDKHVIKLGSSTSTTATTTTTASVMYHRNNESISSIDILDLPPVDYDYDNNSEDSFPTPPTFRTRSRAYSFADPIDPLGLERSSRDEPRATSPDIQHFLSATPRPRRKSTISRVVSAPTMKRRKSEGSVLSDRKTFWDTSVQLLNWEEEEDEAHNSDSSIDLHTPLPNLMLRHGMLSPHSKLLPSSRASTPASTRPGSTLSVLSTIQKDDRNTPMRRNRHRDRKLLRGGIGLTTGLGWSDSEDEDAPSALTRRLSSLNLVRTRTRSIRAPTAWHARSSTSSTPSVFSLEVTIPTTPTRTLATKRDDALNTPSTASTLSIPLPTTPHELDTHTKLIDKEKTLPPLPPSALGKYPSHLSLTAPSTPVRQLQLPRRAVDRPPVPVPFPSSAPRPRPRIGTGMVYRSSSRIKSPSRMVV